MKLSFMFQEILCQTQFLRQILKSGQDHCCEMLEIICPLKQGELETIIKFFYDGNIVSASNENEENYYSKISENLIQVFGFPENISFDCQENQNIEDANNFDPLAIESTSNNFNVYDENIEIENDDQPTKSKIYIKRLIPTDPLDLTNLEDLVPNSDTRQKYTNKWVDFVNFSGLSKSFAPSEALIMAYLEKKWSDGLSGNYLLNILSSMNTIFLHLYKVRLDVSTIHTFFQFWIFYFFTYVQLIIFKE